MAPARVLVIDDDALVRLVVGSVLRRCGFTVVGADTGRAGLARLADDELPDIVLLDVQMPDIDGWQTLTRARSDPRTAELPIVMCTAQDGPKDRLLGWSLGCDGYLRKPIGVRALSATLREVLGLDAHKRETVRRANIAHWKKRSAHGR